MSAIPGIQKNTSDEDCGCQSIDFLAGEMVDDILCTLPGCPRAAAIDALAEESIAEYERGETISLDEFKKAIAPIEGSLRYLGRKSGDDE